MPEVTVTLTLKVEHTDRTEVTTFKPPTTLEPGRVHSILTEAAERLTGQQHLPIESPVAECEHCPHPRNVHFYNSTYEEWENCSVDGCPCVMYEPVSDGGEDRP